MSIKSLLSAVLCLAALAACAHKPDAVPVATAKPTIRLTLLPQQALAVGKATPVLAKLNNIKERTVVTPDQLETVHTQAFHLLVIDPTLTDYQHIHPQATALPGVYGFSFTPKLPGGYRAWADVTPKATGKQEFAMADLGHPKAGAIDKTESHEATVGGYRFTLSFDHAPAVGEEAMGTVHVTAADGSAMHSLEPVMGAYAHIVGFYDDFCTVVHTHPMGAEPKSDSERGGPDITFHLAAVKPGFVKLFAQMKINGKEFFASFGVNVANAP